MPFIPFIPFTPSPIRFLKILRKNSTKRLENQDFCAIFAASKNR